jgi:hypothetical protein
MLKTAATNKSVIKPDTTQYILNVGTATDNIDVQQADETRKVNERQGIVPGYTAFRTTTICDRYEDARIAHKICIYHNMHHCNQISTIKTNAQPVINRQ